MSKESGITTGPRMSATVSASRRAMSPAEVRALAEEVTVTNVETAARAIGISRTYAYELVARGEFPVPVIRVGRREGSRRHRVVVPTAGLLALLGIESV